MPTPFLLVSGPAALAPSRAGSGAIGSSVALDGVRRSHFDSSGDEVRCWKGSTRLSTPQQHRSLLVLSRAHPERPATELSLHRLQVARGAGWRTLAVRPVGQPPVAADALPKLINGLPLSPHPSSSPA